MKQPTSEPGSQQRRRQNLEAVLATARGCSTSSRKGETPLNQHTAQDVASCHVRDHQ